jgi:hypothetical protein
VLPFTPTRTFPLGINARIRVETVSDTPSASLSHWERAGVRGRGSDREKVAVPPIINELAERCDFIVAATWL